MNRNFLLLLTLLFGFVGFLQSQSLEFSYQFEYPELKATYEGYSEITIPGCRNWGEEGNPSVPLYGAD
ncbi:MAG: hypothetical protein FJY07_09520, partial [Bacteroidetes bacterium]|nr:hypothetical protein [Bacteroidota bacterium]